MTTSSSSTFNPTVLRMMRQQTGMSLEAVALEAGLHDKGQISRFEHGHAVPLASTLGRLLQVLRPAPDLLYALFEIERPECTRPACTCNPSCGNVRTVGEQTNVPED